MRLLPVFVVASVLWTALPAAAQEFAAEVTPSDPDARGDLVSMLTRLGYVDANSNSIMDTTEPDENLYLDVDASRTVSFGDLRLTTFFNYGAGSYVDFTNRDFGRFLAEPRGWFGLDTAGVYYVDADGSRTVTLGDVRTSGAQQGSKVRAGDASVGTPLSLIQEIANPPTLRTAYADRDGDNVHDLAEPLYVDVNMNKRADPGELRFTSIGLSVDNDPTRAEFEGLATRLDQRDAELAASDADLAAKDRDLGARIAALGEEVGLWVIVVALVAVAGLVAVAWYARSLFRQSAAGGAPQHRGSPP